jgi:hypothetical protein
MPQTKRLVAGFLAAAMVIGGSAGVVHAFQDRATDSQEAARLAGEGRWRELQLLQAAQQREQFQRQQQHYREQDRGPLRHQLPRAEVPRMRPGCQIQLFGRNALTGCR